MIERSLKAKALVFAIFLIGVGTGVVITNFYTSRMMGDTSRPQRAQRDINKFYDYLGLNQDQREQMHRIGEDTRHEFQQLSRETQPRYQAIQEESRAKIRAVLNDEQRAKYDEFRKKMDERRRNRELNGETGPKPEHGPQRPN
jgi:hypothetical protein